MTTFQDLLKAAGVPSSEGQINLKEAKIGLKHDPSVNPTGPYGHGNGGLFSRPGADPRIFSTIMLPDAGLLDALPTQFDPMAGQFGGFDASLNTVITGVTSGNLDNVANQPTAACDPGPQGGLMKLCTFVSPLGTYSGSFTVDLNKMGHLRDYADNPNQTVMNLAKPDGNMIPAMPGGMFDVVANEVVRRMYQSFVSFKRMLVSRVWVGNPTNSAGSNNWQDLMGMELIVNAGNKVDYQTAAVCTAANSDIKEFGYRTVDDNAAALYSHLDMLYYYSLWNARKQQLGTPGYVWVMRPELFDEIAKIWPIAEITEALAALGAVTAGRVNLTGNEILAMRNAIREGQYLPIRGQLVPVILDDTITELDSTTSASLIPGRYASDIYLIPMTVLGGFPVTFAEPYNQANAVVERVVAMGGLTHTWTSDGGQVRWYLSAQRNCLQYSYTTSFRIKMLTTQLAGRLQHVAYEPLQHVRSWNPASPYFFDGGGTSFDAAKYYTAWSTGTQVVIP